MAGVLTWDEMQVRVAAEVGAELGVATMPVEAARACRDKARQRERFRATGVASARYELAGSEAEAAAAAETIGYPVVLKPRGQAASIAVRIVRSEAELRETFALVRDAENPSIEDGLVLVEEFLAGPEIAVDSWVLDGKVVPFSISAKRTGYPPYFEEVAHVVGKVLDARTEAAVREVVIAANEALGIDRAVTHTELMLTADGPKVVEVNGRLGGDLIPTSRRSRPRACRSAASSAPSPPAANPGRCRSRTAWSASASSTPPRTSRSTTSRSRPGSPTSRGCTRYGGSANRAPNFACRRGSSSAARAS